MTPQQATPLVHGPSEAADRMGLTVAGLVALIRARRYPFTELRPGGRPGDRGRNRWGLTDAQIVAILRGQERVPPDPSPPPAGPARVSPVAPDGKSRLRRGSARR
jgi:hypothetical protein